MREVCHARKAAKMADDVSLTHILPDVMIVHDASRPESRMSFDVQLLERRKGATTPGGIPLSPTRSGSAGPQREREARGRNPMRTSLLTRTILVLALGAAAVGTTGCTTSLKAYTE